MYCEMCLVHFSEVADQSAAVRATSQPHRRLCRRRVHLIQPWIHCNLAPRRPCSQELTAHRARHSDRMDWPSSTRELTVAVASEQNGHNYVVWHQGLYSMCNSSLGAVADESAYANNSPLGVRPSLAVAGTNDQCWIFPFAHHEF